MADENESDFEIINEGGVTDDYLSVDGIELPDKEVEDEKVEKLYRRDPIVHRAVEKEIEDLFGLRPSVEADSKELEDAIKELLFGKTTDLYKNFKEASKGSYLNGMALIYLNFDNSEDIKTEPDAVEEVTQSGVIYKKDVHDYKLDKDLTSENFNEVRSWILEISKEGSQDVKDDGGVRRTTSEDLADEVPKIPRTEVNASRVIHVVYDTIFNDPWGISKIAPEFDSHIYRKTIVESAVSAFHQNAEGIRAFSLPEKATDKERKFLRKNIKMLNVRSDMMIPHGTEILHPGPDLADPSDLIEHLMETSTAMPYQILTGTQAGQVTGSETNLMIYYIEINKRRRGKINDMLMDKLEYLQEKGALPEGDFSLDWGDVLPPNHEEEAGILSKTAVAVERLYDSGVVSEEEARDMLVEMTGVSQFV